MLNISNTLVILCHELYLRQKRGSNYLPSITKYQVFQDETNEVVGEEKSVKNNVIIVLVIKRILHLNFF